MNRIIMPSVLKSEGLVTLFKGRRNNMWISKNELEGLKNRIERLERDKYLEFPKYEDSSLRYAENRGPIYVLKSKQYNLLIRKKFYTIISMRDLILKIFDFLNIEVKTIDAQDEKIVLQKKGKKI